MAMKRTCESCRGDRVKKVRSLAEHVEGKRWVCRDCGWTWLERRVA